MESKKKAGKIFTPVFRVSFPNILNAKANQRGEMRYSIAMLFDKKKTDFSELKKMVANAIKEKWGDKPPKGLRSPFRDGDEKDYEGYKGNIFCNASSVSRPGLLDEKAQPIIDPQEFYPGCFAHATVTAFAYDHMGNQGVAIGLRNIQKVKDGDPIAGRTKPEDDFDAIESSDEVADDNDGGASIMDLG